jgi:hypothetical protein
VERIVFFKFGINGQNQRIVLQMSGGINRDFDQNQLCACPSVDDRQRLYQLIVAILHPSNAQNQLYPHKHITSKCTYLCGLKI